jgi:hypothetical protein
MDTTGSLLLNSPEGHPFDAGCQPEIYQDNSLSERMPLNELPGSFHTGFLINVATSDLASDALSQSESLSQTPGGSTSTSMRARDSANNPIGRKPTSLSYYRSTDVHAPLTEAKESFAATAFASGCFFYHQRSPHLDTFQTYARDAIALAADAYGSKPLTLLLLSRPFG